MTKSRIIGAVVTLCFGVACGLPAHAFFVNGSGHYSVKARKKTQPTGDSKLQAEEGFVQSLLLGAEIQRSEKTSYNLGLTFFSDPAQSLLGDVAQAETCVLDGGAIGRGDQCAQNQNVLDSSYQAYRFLVKKAYLRHASKYCIVEAGRRGRDWGLGLLFDSGERPFSRQQTIFDGISCHVNIQKTQNIGFAFGLDKLRETGPTSSGSVSGLPFSDDDIDQYYFLLEMDERQTNTTGAFSRHIGLYLSSMSAPGFNNLGGTDIYFMDLYIGLYFNKLSIQSELILRRGKSGDKNIRLLGGAAASAEAADAGAEGGASTGGVKNNVETMGWASRLSWSLAKSGSYIGPKSYRQGDYEESALFLDLAYAPGENQGYYEASLDEATNVGISKRENKTRAMGFNRNYQPALILFGDWYSGGNRSIEGVYDGSRLINTVLIAGGYSYDSLSWGKLEASLIWARLEKEMPSDVKAYYIDKEDKRIGYYGSDLGVEIDCKYSMFLDHGTDLTLGAGILKPGEAFKTKDDQSLGFEYLLEVGLSVKL